MPRKFTLQDIAVAVVGIGLSFGIFASMGCSKTEPTPDCREKFVRMLEPCVPKCESEDAAGKASDSCIRKCVQEEFGESVPEC